MNIAALLRAAEFLERREREAEHGYASILPRDDDDDERNARFRKSFGNRSTHNEMEKNRRAHLRSCLEKLKEIVPLGAESNRHTTLGLLTKAKSYIKVLEERGKHHQTQLEQLLREQRFLRRKLNQLETRVARDKPRSISECSSGTSVYTSSSLSETDDIDIIGYNSNQSDTDDHSSIQSLTSDGGIVINTKRLSLDVAAQ